MWNIRTSVPEDIPAQRQLWKLAFGDEDAYIDNFYQTYYRPERVLVLEEEGSIRAMTAWFDTVFRLPGEGDFRAAYLYAVATHPDCRGRGMSGALLAWADEYFRSLSIPAVTTVPAQPSLHNFFGRNGFRECFVLDQRKLEAENLPGPEPGVQVRRAAPEEYGALREELLGGTPHIAYPVEALEMQAGCCRVDGGGLYIGESKQGPFCLCAEEAGPHLTVCKELLGGSAARRAALSVLSELGPDRAWLIREPADLKNGGNSAEKFAMLKWIDQKTGKNWDWGRTAFLGLAFD